MGQHNVSFRGSGIQFISIFDENIASGTADISSYTIRLSGQVASDAFLSGVVEYANPEDADDRSRLLFTPFSGQLLGSSYYNVYIGQRITDDFGSALTSTLTWSFITAGVDDSPMILKSFTPVSGTALAPFSQTIEAVFTKQISGIVNETGYTNCIFLWNDNIPSAGVSGVTMLDDVTSGKKLVFTPIALLQPATLYRYTISGVYDLFDNTHTPVSGVAFSTGPSDTAGPIISGLAPSGYPVYSGNINVHPSVSGNVSTLTNITVTFNERLSGIPGGTISGQVISLVNSGDVAVNLSGVITLSASGNVLTFDPVAELISGTTYRIMVSGVMDVNGNTISQTSPPRSGWSFITWVDPDVSPPVVQSITPASGTLAVAVASNIVVTFNEALSGTHPDANFTAIVAVDLSGTGSVAGTASTNSSGTVVTFNPTADLSGDRNYYVSVSGALDRAIPGNRMTPVSGHLFRTLDNIAPVISGIVPISGQVDFAANGNILITLSEATSGTAGGTLGAQVIRLVKSGVPGTSFAGVSTLDGTRTIITFNPNADLDQAEHYHVSVSGIMDVSGNMMTHPGTGALRTSGHSFVTQGGPNITLTNPVSGATNFPLGQSIVVTFNKALSGTPNGTITSPVFRLATAASPGTALAGTNTLNSDSTQLTFNPTADLIANTNYVFAISGAYDLSGLIIAQTSPPRSGFAFTSLTVDTTPPTFTSTTPLSGVTGVLTDTTFVANFSETISGTIGQNMPAYAIRMAISGHNQTTSGVAGTTVKTAAAQLTFTPTVPLSGDRWYRVFLSGIYDTATPGNIIEHTPLPDRNINIAFRTVDNIAPVISSISPSAGATGVIVTNNVVVTLGEVCSGNILGGTVVNQVISMIKQGVPGTLIGGTISIDSTRKIFTFDPSNNLDQNTTYEVSISGIRDLADNFVAPVTAHAFTSQAQPLDLLYNNTGGSHIARPLGTVSPVITRVGIKRNTESSVLNQTVPKRLTLPLRKIGNGGGGTLKVIIRRDTEGDDAIQTTFTTTKLASDISTTKTDYVFEHLSNTYALDTNDAVSLEYTGGSQNSSNTIEVYYTNDAVDGGNTIYFSLASDYNYFNEERDLVAKLEGDN